MLLIGKISGGGCGWCDGGYNGRGRKARRGDDGDPDGAPKGIADTFGVEVTAEAWEEGTV
jgi:hypothetical protein